MRALLFLLGFLAGMTGGLMPLPVVTAPADDSYYQLKNGATVLVTLEASFREVDPLPRRNLTPVRTAGGSDLFYRGDGRPLPGLKVLEGLVHSADEWTLGTRLAAIRSALATATTLARVTPDGTLTWALESEPVAGFLTDAPASSPGKAFQRRVTLFLLATSLASEPAATIPTVTLPDPVTGTPGSVTYPGASADPPPSVVIPSHTGGSGGILGPIPYVTDFIAGSTVTGHPQVVVPDLNIGYGAAGDLALAAFALTDNAAATITPPSGWTLVERTDNTTNGLTLVTYSKVAEAADSGAFQTFTISGGDTTKAHVGSLVMYRAVGSIGAQAEDAPTGLASWVTLPALETTRPLVREVVVVGMRGVTGASGPSVDQLAPYKVDQDYSAGIAGVSLISTPRPEGGLLLDSAGDPGEFTISTGDTQDAYRVVQRLALYPTVN
jgi:hypothetical protein